MNLKQSNTFHETIFMFSTTTTNNLNNGITTGKRYIFRWFISNTMNNILKHCNKKYTTTLDLLWPFPFQEILFTVKIHAYFSYWNHIHHTYDSLQFYPTWYLSPLFSNILSYQSNNFLSPHVSLSPPWTISYSPMYNYQRRTSSLMSQVRQLKFP